MFQSSKHVPERLALPAARGRRRQRHQRHHRLRPHQLLRDRAVESARARAVARVGSHGLPARQGRSGGALQPAGRRAQRAASERREPAVRPGRRGADAAAASRRAIPTTATSSARTRTSRRPSSTTCKQFFKRYYAPNNASLAIVGDFDPAQAKALVEKYFGTLKRGPAVPPIDGRRRRRSPSERRKVVPARVELPRVYMAWLTSPIFKPGDADADIAAHDPRRRPLEPPVQEAGLREADRAERHARSSSR